MVGKYSFTEQSLPITAYYTGCNLLIIHKDEHYLKKCNHFE